MPKYLFHINYLQPTVQEIVDQGGTHRKQRATALAEGAGGSLESFYFAFGATDAYAIGNLPDDESAASISLRVNQSGDVAVSVTKLLTVEQMDAAAKKVQS